MRARRRKTEKNAKRGNKSNIELELSNFKYHRKCYRTSLTSCTLIQQRAHTSTQVLMRHYQLYSGEYIKQGEQDMEHSELLDAK